jgi:methionyl-tRNA formyltransferase
VRLRVVVFGSGSPLSVAALACAARSCDVVGVVTPAGPALRGLRSVVRRFARRRAAGPLRRQAGQMGLRVIPATRRLERDLARLAPDLLCVASFPRLLSPRLLATARHGAIGLHPALLPRHRGPDPLFWTYLHDDQHAGITLHWLDAGEDTGDVLYQEAVPLTRGRPVVELYGELVARGAGLLERALGEIPSGRAPRQPQDAARATREPRPDAGACRIDWEAWSAERVCHVLGGLGRSYPLLRAGSARPVRVEGTRRSALPTAPRPPGTLEPCAGGFRVHCRDGVVEVWEAAERP